MSKNKGGRPKKDQFQDIPSEWKDKVDQSSRTEIDTLFADTAKNQAANLAAQKADDDLEETRQLLRMKNSPYRETTKLNKLKMEYLRQSLENKGG